MKNAISDQLETKLQNDHRWVKYLLVELLVEPYTFHSIRTRMQKFSLTKGKPYRYQRNGFRNMVI